MEAILSYNSNFYKDDFLVELYNKLPPIFTRETASRMMGGIFSARTLSNFDAAGNGPPKKVYIGKKVAYERSDFINWLGKFFNNNAITPGKNKRKMQNYYW